MRTRDSVRMLFNYKLQAWRMPNLREKKVKTNLSKKRLSSYTVAADVLEALKEVPVPNSLKKKRFYVICTTASS